MGAAPASRSAPTEGSSNRSSPPHRGQAPSVRRPCAIGALYHANWQAVHETLGRRDWRSVRSSCALMHTVSPAAERRERRVRQAGHMSDDAGGAAGASVSMPRS
jgi:hypothetical protein